MFEDLFSKRYKLRPTPEGLLYTEVPERARIGLYHIVEKYFNQDYRNAFLELYTNFCVALRIPRSRGLGDYEASRAIEKLINECEWWQLYDICDVMWQTLEYPYGNREELSKDINTLFQEEQLGFEMREGKIEKFGSGFIDAKIKEVRYLLKEPELKSADELFEKAIKALNMRPNPDEENCIKDAVGAIESVGRIITNNEKASLDDIIKNAVKKGVIPKPLDQTFIKLYAYRGNEPAIAHGGIEPSKVTVDEAELILAMSAAMIIYLVKKRSKL